MTAKNSNQTPKIVPPANQQEAVKNTVGTAGKMVLFAIIPPALFTFLCEATTMIINYWMNLPFNDTFRFGWWEVIAWCLIASPYFVLNFKRLWVNLKYLF